MGTEGTETGLPDYVGDHFAYILKAGRGPRIGQAIFFGSSLLLPVIMGVILLTWSGQLPAASRGALYVTTAVFAVSTIWYLIWMQVRLEKFRTQCPDSYNCWYGINKRRSFAGMGLGGQLRLAKIQASYVFLGKEPPASETLDLTMRFSRRAG
ncbi:MAG: hypothetical protein ACR2FO_08535 [Actinomycetota bacterium]